MDAQAGVLPAARELRSYQAAAVAAVERDWAAGKRRVGVVLPTGAGKSTVIGKLAADRYTAGQRILCIAHRGELVDQMRRDFIAVAPDLAPITGVVRADRNDVTARVVFATLQTLASTARRAALEAHGQFDVILWDEVHHAGAEGFHATFDELGGYRQALMCGFTATMYRNEQGTIGLGDVIQKISYEKDLRWAIKHGFLVQPRGLTVRIKNLDALNDVRTVAGDFKNDELAEVMEAAVEYVVDAIEQHAADRTNIVFAASVDGAHMIADSMNDRGLSAEAVTGAMPYDQRTGVYDRYRSGVTRNLVTVMVLTEGADFPMCDTVVMARPTRSRNLYAQMVGRALRLFEGKTDALVLDLSGSTRQMKLVNLTDLDHGAEVTDVDENGAVLAICPDCNLFMTECQCGAGSAETEVKIVRQGPVDLVTIDLLANSDTLWLETPMGVPFVSGTEGWVVFLWPEGSRRVDGTSQRWMPGLTNTKRQMQAMALERKGETAGYIDLDDAVDFAEAWVYESGERFVYNDRGASWRRNQPPSDKQVNFARNLGVVGADQMTKARLSDEISIKIAAKVLDLHMQPRTVMA